MEKNEIILFETKDKSIVLPVTVENENVWLNRQQMAELFDRDVKTIGKHINNASKEEVEAESTVAKFATVQKEGCNYLCRLSCKISAWCRISQMGQFCFKTIHH